MIDVIAKIMEVMDIVIGSRCNENERRDGDGDGACYRIEALMHVIDLLTMVMDFVIGKKL